jgi:UDP-glucose 4-epimerase
MTITFLGSGGRLGRLMQPRWHGDVRWLTRADGDVRDTGALAASLQPADIVFCLAGVTNPSHGDMDDNVTLARSALDAAALAGAGRVFLFSSAAVYGDQNILLQEDSPTRPQSDYALAKLQMEEMAHLHPHPNTVLRLGNVAGADAILGGWRDGFHLDRLPDGTTPKRSYIGPGALVRVLQGLARRQSLPERLNVAAPGSVAMGDLLDAANLVWAARPATGKTIANVTLDTGLLSGLTDFAPSDSTPEGIVADWMEGQRQ